MLNQAFQYDLSYKSANKQPQTTPEIVFTINELHLPELRERLYEILSQHDKEVDQYFDDKTVGFSLPNSDLFGNIDFGYGKCGYCTSAGNDFNLHIKLVRETQKYCAQTINVLFQALNPPFKVLLPTDKFQQIELYTLAEISRSSVGLGYGHAISGRLANSVIDWLLEYIKSHTPPTDKGGPYTTSDMPRSVNNAMRETWCHINSEEVQEWAKECRGYVRPSGHFTLVCFGNACDLSVYPEQRINSDLGYVELDCHNLDTAAQQLTLLAGLAKLCELVRAG